MIFPRPYSHCAPLSVVTKKKFIIFHILRLHNRCLWKHFYCVTHLHVKTFHNMPHTKNKERNKEEKKSFVTISTFKIRNILHTTRYFCWSVCWTQEEKKSKTKPFWLLFFQFFLLFLLKFSVYYSWAWRLDRRTDTKGNLYATKV